MWQLTIEGKILVFKTLAISKVETSCFSEMKLLNCSIRKKYKNNLFEKMEILN